MAPKKQNKLTKQKQTHRYKEQTNGCQLGHLVEEGEGIKKYKLSVTKYSWEYKLQHREYRQ